MGKSKPRVKDPDARSKDKKGVKEETAKPRSFADKKKRVNIVRLMETNVDGDKPLASAINSVKGVAPMFGNAVVLAFGNADKKVIDLSDSEIAKVEEIIANPEKHNIPALLFNRRNDPETGVDMHSAVSSLALTKTMDINNMKKLRSYRGIRHMFGLPVRGQRTKGSFRKNKTVGVSRKKGKK